MALSGILLKVLGWKAVGEMPPIEKSVIIFAPHTSYWDGLYGKLFLMQFGMNYKFLSKKEFFKFPLNLFFKLYGSIPVSNNKEYIDEIVTYYKNSKNLHIVLSPEGKRAKTDHWKKGFYYIANRAQVPIMVGFMDYKKKECGFKGVIYNTDSMEDTFREIGEYYKPVTAKHPENFALDKRYC